MGKAFSIFQPPWQVRTKLAVSLYCAMLTFFKFPWISGIAFNILLKYIFIWSGSFRMVHNETKLLINSGNHWRYPVLSNVQPGFNSLRKKTNKQAHPRVRNFAFSFNEWQSCVHTKEMASNKFRYNLLSADAWFIYPCTWDFIKISQERKSYGWDILQALIYIIPEYQEQLPLLACMWLVLVFFLVVFVRENWDRFVNRWKPMQMWVSTLQDQARSIHKSNGYIILNIAFYGTHI